MFMDNTVIAIHYLKSGINDINQLWAVRQTNDLILPRDVAPLHEPLLAFNPGSGRHTPALYLNHENSNDDLHSDIWM